MATRVAPLAYLVQIDHVTYEPKDGRPGFTLVEAMREAYGVGNARVWRINADDTISLVVRGAGRASAVQHAPTGRMLNRRPADHFVSLRDRELRARLARLDAKVA